MEFDPQVAPYLTSDTHSFAFVSAQSRWGIILTGAIEDVRETVNGTLDETTREEGAVILDALENLKSEIEHDAALTPIEKDDLLPVDDYNKELLERGSISWRSAPWLYVECYLYRRLATIFNRSAKWQGYDVFARQKVETFQSSRPAVLELAARYRQLLAQLASKSNGSQASDTRKTEEALFSEMCEVCLWGNATDLSLLTSLSYNDIQKLQGSAARKAAEKNILVNDLPKVFADLKAGQEQRPNDARRIDIVLDNAGFELFVDLVLSGYLIEAGLATQVVLHPKSIPWFVSDVMPKDFDDLLDALRDPGAFYAAANGATNGGNAHIGQPLSEGDIADLKFLHSHWSMLHTTGRLVVKPDQFWTQGGSFWRLPYTAAELYGSLRQSELVIFKGDLNSRKLAGDCMWPAHTAFAESLGPLATKGKGLKVLALRTCKVDTVVGLPPGEDERLRATEGGGDESGSRKWAWSGKWAVVLFNDAR